MTTKEKREEKRRWDRVEEEIVTGYLRQFKLDDSGDLKEKAKRLEDHFLAQPVPRLTCLIGKTSGCGFHAPQSIDQCPFCGDAEVDPSLTPAPAPAPAEAKIVKTERNKRPKVQGPTDPPPAKAAGEPARGEAEAAKGTGAAIVSPGGGAISAAEKELDEAVARINEIRKRELENYWDLGKELLVVYDKKLYEQRRDAATGAPLYKSFGQFLQREFGFSDVHCFRMMDVAREFDRPTAIELGVKKAHLLHSVRAALDAHVKTEPQRKAAQEQFAKFVERAKAESFVDLEKDLQPIIRAAPALDHGRRGHGGRPKGQAPAQAPTAPQKERVTCAFELGKRTVPLYVHGGKGTRAKKLADAPFGKEELVNGVLVRYEVRQGQDGFLELDISVKRPD